MTRKRATGTERQRLSLDALWQAPAVLWMLLFGEGVALVLALAPAATGDRFGYFVQASIALQWVLLATLVGMYALRGWLSQLAAFRVGVVALALFMAFGWLIAQAAFALMGDSWNLGGEPWAEHGLRLVALSATLGLLGLAALHGYLRMRRSEARMHEAELQALQARIQPHFLFNTLNTGAALAQQNPAATEQLLLDLAELFRAALAGPREVTLEEELALVRRYLEIESLRFGERLRTVWNLPSPLPDVDVPALSIQPLVENAIRHGVERIPHGGRVEISVSTTSDYTVVRITNPVALSDRDPPVSHRVGLNASRVRIEALTGGRGRVETGRKGELYVATVRLPRTPSPPPRPKWR